MAVTAAPTVINPMQVANQGYSAASSAVGVPAMGRPIGVDASGNATPYAPPAAANKYLQQLGSLIHASLASSQGILANEAKFGAESGPGGMVAGYAPSTLNAALEAPETAGREATDAGLGMERNSIIGEQAGNEAVAQANANKARIAQAQYGAYGNALRTGGEEFGDQLRANSTSQGDALRAYSSVMNAGRQAALMGALNPQFNVAAYEKSLTSTMPSFLKGITVPAGMPGFQAAN